MTWVEAPARSAKKRSRQSKTSRFTGHPRDPLAFDERGRYMKAPQIARSEGRSMINQRGRNLSKDIHIKLITNPLFHHNSILSLLLKHRLSLAPSRNRLRPSPTGRG